MLQLRNVCLFVFLSVVSSYGDLGYVARDAEPMYQGFLDEEFPFLEVTLDLREIAPKGNQDNLVTRGIILPLDNDVFVCFDTELLRVMSIWQGDFVSLDGIALLSYDVPLRKMGGGQRRLPKPNGEVAFATGLYPGWQRPAETAFEDPRSRWLKEDELGRGPLNPEHGEWLGTEDAGDHAVLNYSLFGGSVREAFHIVSERGRILVSRTIELEGVEGPLNLILNDLGVADEDTGRELDAVGDLSYHENRYLVYTSEGTSSKKIFQFLYDLEGRRVSVGEAGNSINSITGKKDAHWPTPAISKMELGELQGGFRVDEAVLPYPNPWKRNIRPAGIDFFPNGDAVIVTFDGDVYRISGLGTSDDSIEWRRIAAGFNEPQSIRIREDEMFIFSRLGVTRLVDRDSDGEMDFYSMFSNRFTQSADTRDFTMSLVLRPDNSFLICKGGQQERTRTPHSGRILSISEDGKDVTLFAYGLRNGYLAAHPTKDLVSTSDQQGNWVPATPFHIVREGSFLGYQPGAADEAVLEEPQPAALWLPHRVVQCSIAQVWAEDPRMGQLADSVLYIDYNRPAIVQVFAPDTEPIVQTPGMLLPIKFGTPLLKGEVNPTDGMPYFVGFQIWDSRAERIAGLCRLSVVGKSNNLPSSVETTEFGVRLSFDEALDPEKAKDPANYMASSWEYERTEKYGSAQHKADGSPGADEWFIHSVLLSEDKRSVFLAIDGVRKTMQLEVQFNLFDEWTSVYFTMNKINPTELDSFKFQSTNFPRLFATDPTPRVADASLSIISEARGQELYHKMGCVTCHSIDGTTEGRSGPTWLGFYKSYKHLPDGSRVRVDEEFVRNSILEPSQFTSAEFDNPDVGMPSYKGVLSEEELQSLVIYIRSLMFVR